MANSDWVEADRVDQLKPQAQLMYDWCMDWINSNPRPVRGSFGITEVRWDYLTNEVRIRGVTVTKKCLEHFEVFSAKELKKELEWRECPVPESLQYLCMKIEEMKHD